MAIGITAHFWYNPPPFAMHEHKRSAQAIGGGVATMWDMMQNVKRQMTKPPKRQTSMGTLPALLLGAGVGIATWELVRRRTLTTPEYDATPMSAHME